MTATVPNVAPVGGHRPPALMTGVGGRIVSVEPGRTYPVRVEAPDGSTHYFRADELEPVAEVTR